ncbi:protein TIFY 8 isoform X2 [Aristolochia californica]|uniref:protein TIFY 8 isoform X2 n=1 Tax=Aristolochia californica TaxID=171875 RepID=UPI0035D8771C
MAVLMMANDEGKPIFHDFFGVSCKESPVLLAKTGVPDTRLSEASPSASVGASSGGHGHVSASSDLGSERQTGSNFEGVQFYGPKGDFSGAEISNRFSGRKRSNSDSAFMGSTRDRMLQIPPESIESSRLTKMQIFQNESGSERPRRAHEDELFFGMLPPRQTSTSPLTLQPPIGSRHDLTVSNWDRSLPRNAGFMVHYPPRVSQIANIDKNSSGRNRDASATTMLISQPAADEGSRTGIKSSGVLKVINSNAGVSERLPTAFLTNNSRPNASSPTTETDNTNLSRLTTTSRQMTIFYAGQAHVFDDVHPNKADAIMAMAGSTGGSWSTTYSPKTSIRPPPETFMTHSGENDTAINNNMTAFSQELHGRSSVLGTSSGIFNQAAKITFPNQGVSPGGRAVRDARTAGQAAGPDTQGKKEV